MPGGAILHPAVNRQLQSKRLAIIVWHKLKSPLCLLVAASVANRLRVPHDMIAHSIGRQTRDHGHICLGHLLTRATATYRKSGSVAEAISNRSEEHTSELQSH